MDLAVGGADHAVSRAAKLDFALRGFVKFEACLRPVFKNYEGVLSDLKSPSPSRNAVIEGAGDDRIHCDLVTFAFDVIVLLENGTLRPNLLSFFSIKGMVCSFFGKFDDVIVRVGTCACLDDVRRSGYIDTPVSCVQHLRDLMPAALRHRRIVPFVASGGTYATGQVRPWASRAWASSPRARGPPRLTT